MDEATLRMQAQLLALKADLDALEYKVIAMKTDNQYMSSVKRPPLWSAEQFREAANQAVQLARRFRTEI